MVANPLFGLTDATIFDRFKNLTMIFIRATSSPLIRKVDAPPLSGHFIEGFYNTKQNVVFGRNKNPKMKSFIFELNRLPSCNAPRSVC